MSKEQTPITAEEFRNDYAKKLQYLNWDDLCEDLWSKGDAMTKTENEVMEQYAQAKVLEALEREVPKAFKTGAEENFVCMCYDADQRNFNENTYFETQVKPKYQNKDE
jgi:hypothetical protein